jgi:hypothetical protein
MPIFTPNQPIETDQPLVEVTVNADNLLPVGVHTFQLVVTDDAGNTSLPALVEIVVRDIVAPTAVIDGPRLVGFNQSFDLSGARSSDPAPGRIVLFTWTLIDNPSRPPIFEPVRPVLIDPIRPVVIGPVVGPR